MQNVAYFSAPATDWLSTHFTCSLRPHLYGCVCVCVVNVHIVSTTMPPPRPPAASSSSTAKSHIKNHSLVKIKSILFHRNAMKNDVEGAHGLGWGLAARDSEVSCPPSPPAHLPPACLPALLRHSTKKPWRTHTRTHVKKEKRKSAYL